MIISHFTTRFSCITSLPCNKRNQGEGGHQKVLTMRERANKGVRKIEEKLVKGVGGGRLLSRSEEGRGSIG